MTVPATDPYLDAPFPTPWPGCFEPLALTSDWSHVSDWLSLSHMTTLHPQESLGGEAVASIRTQMEEPKTLSLQADTGGGLRDGGGNFSLRFFFTICICVHICAVTHGGQKSMLGSLELELPAVRNYLMWVLGAELWSSVRASGILTAVPPLLPVRGDLQSSFGASQPALPLSHWVP